MCYTGKCPHEDHQGVCIADWDNTEWYDNCYLQDQADRAASEMMTYPLPYDCAPRPRLRPQTVLEFIAHAESAETEIKSLRKQHAERVLHTDTRIWRTADGQQVKTVVRRQGKQIISATAFYATEEDWSAGYIETIQPKGLKI